jgi:hypothetical protein
MACQSSDCVLGDKKAVHTHFEREPNISQNDRINARPASCLMSHQTADLLCLCVAYVPPANFLVSKEPQLNAFTSFPDVFYNGALRTENSCPSKVEAGQLALLFRIQEVPSSNICLV